ncbi:unnamed protein product [Paramecium sonneborni]|uniref:Protein kinase domain-containing protein n=1 Tax=Paramecium sonneborni TaxID=65129 RepID=A0A8S1RJ63_9CILI|nr:unnamed protein product [Paramecium sonneborni]
MDQNHLKLNFSQFIVEKLNSYTDDYKQGVIRKIKKQGVLGVLAFSQVRKVIHRKTRAIRAMKVISKSRLSTNYNKSLQTKSMFIKLCTGGELFDKIIEKGSVSEKEASQILKQIMSAILMLKLETRKFKEMTILKFFDRGTAKIFSPNQQINEKFGTLYYMAPEVLKLNYNEKCDIWQCGVILYILLFGVPPYNGRTDAEIQKNILNGIYIRW